MSTKYVLNRKFIVNVAILALMTPVTAYSQAPEHEPVLQELAAIAQAYDIDINTSGLRIPFVNPRRRIDAKSADAKTVEGCASVFADEFALYPQDLVKRAKLKRIILCRDLTFNGQEVGGVTDFPRNAMYLDIYAMRDDKAFLRHSIHHEFFHVIDNQDGSSYDRDESWEAINAPSFKYEGKGAESQYGHDILVVTDKYPGFLNEYATMSVAEDKAEVFSNMIVRASYVDERIKNDPILKLKVRLLKRELMAFCPEMNDEFWKKIGAVNRSENKNPCP